MAVAVASVQTVAWTGCDNGQTIVITKPVSLAVGDLMVAHISGADEASGSNTITAPNGWTTLGNLGVGSSGSADLYVFYKVADAGDTAATNFTFTNSSGAGLMMAGAIYRITGQGGTPSLQIAIDGDTTNDLTPTFTNTVTPVFADSLLLFLVTAQDNQISGSVSGYAITTSNPTWTEQYDIYGTGDTYFGAGDGDGLMAGASATRPEVTATGDSTCTFVNFAGNCVGAIVVIPPLTSVTVSPSVLNATFSVQAPSVTAGATVTVSAALSATFSVQAPTVSFPTPDFTNLDKSATSTFTNPDKS